MEEFARLFTSPDSEINSAIQESIQANLQLSRRRNSVILIMDEFNLMLWSLGDCQLVNKGIPLLLEDADTRAKKI